MPHFARYGTAVVIIYSAATALKRFYEQERFEFMSTIRDRLWLWGHEAGSHNEEWNLPAASQIMPAQAAENMGIPNIIMVRYRQELFFGCYADPDALPDVHQLPALIEAELRQLGRAATRTRAGDAT